jgi:CRP-like cAMP-binding protein
LLLQMQTLFFSAGSVIASSSKDADMLMIIVSGRVRLYQPGFRGRVNAVHLIGPG